jgi:eukaryotic-like serine/threonine-protein kinase
LRDESSDMTNEGSERCCEFGPFRLDVSQRKLWRNEELIVLAPKAFDALAILVLARGRVLEKDELLRLIWPDTFVGEDSLTQTISVLRKALGDTAYQSQYVLTVPRRGYRFLAKVSGRDAGEEAAGVNRGTEVGMPSPIAFPRRPGRPARVGIVAFAASTLVALALFGLSRSGKVNSERTVFEVLPPDGTALDSAGVLSPNGRNLAFVTKDIDGRRVLRVQDFSSSAPITIGGTEEADEPFWSPDSESLAFFTPGKLKRVSLAGGPPKTITDASTQDLLVGPGGGGSWNRADEIVFAPSVWGGLYRVPASGGVATPITRINPAAGERAHRWPSFLPDGRHFLYTVAAAASDATGVYVGSLDSTTAVRVLTVRSQAVYAAPGELLFRHGEALMAQAFDARHLRPFGTPMLIADHVAARVLDDHVAVTAADNGTLAYVSRTGSTSTTHLAWFDRAGRIVESFEASEGFANPVLSPDDLHVAAMRRDPDTGIPQMWLLDLQRGVVSRFISGPLPIAQALWSPDGTSVVFSSGANLYRRAVTGAGEAELLLKTSEPKLGHDWSPDGRFIVYTTVGAETQWDLWLLPLFGDRKPSPFLRTRFNEYQGQVSPDGRWIAYASDDSGVPEVYVQPFPKPGMKQRISVAGGSEPKWRRDGRELFYLTADQNLMALEVKSGTDFEAGIPRRLFQTHVAGVARNHYAVATDGQRFLFDTISDPKGLEPITVVLNWTATAGK